MEEVIEKELSKNFPDASDEMKEAFRKGFMRGVYQRSLERANFQYELERTKTKTKTL